MTAFQQKSLDEATALILISVLPIVAVVLGLVNGGEADGLRLKPEGLSRKN